MVHQDFTLVRQLRSQLVDSLTRRDEKSALDIINQLDYLNFCFSLNNQPRLDRNLTPLHLGAILGLEKVVSALLAKGANAKMQTQTQKYTPLHYAVLYRKEAITKALMQHDEMLKDEQDEFGKTPVHLAAQTSGHPCLFHLLFFYAGSFKYSYARPEKPVTDNQGATPLHYAALNESQPNIEALLEYGFNPSDIDQYSKKAVNWTDNADIQAVLHAAELPTLMQRCSLVATDSQIQSLPELIQPEIIAYRAEVERTKTQRQEWEANQTMRSDPFLFAKSRF